MARIRQALAEPGNPIPLHSLARYSGSFDQGSVTGPGLVLPFTLQQVITGPNTLLGPPPIPTLGPLLVDDFTGSIYASSGVGIYVYPTKGDGDLAPTRIMRVTGDIQALALDRTR